jgi:integrase
MARLVDRLTPLKVKNLTAKKSIGRHADGAGLYLQIDADGSCSWIFMWKRGGKRRVMGLGSERIVSLGEARKKRKAAERLVEAGKDPIAERIAERNKANTEAMTFGEAAAQCHAMLKSGWRSAKHGADWLPFLAKHAQPLFAKAVDKITPDDVVRVLNPLWNNQQDLASRLRMRIQRVLNWATAKGLRHGDNPAAWEGKLQDWMAKPAPKHTLVRHMRALHYDKMPAFMASLRQVEGVNARALEFTILTAARTCETYGATWDEINFEHGLWTVPGERMKMRKAHIVPLSDRALQITKDRFEERSSRLIFPGVKDDRRLSNSAMLYVLERLGIDATVHGFRSTFRDWAGDLMATRFPDDIVELALAHVVGNATKRAYRRGTALEQRRELMNAWAAYCERSPQVDNVVAMRRAEIPA